MSEPTQEYVREHLNYDPDTGDFTWAVRKPGRRIGVPIRAVATGGYYRATIGGIGYGLHRLAWLYVHGEMPAVVDHINGIPSDNRISNLRLACGGRNQKNTRKSRRNKSGVKGVSWNASAGKWQCFVHFQGKNRNVGSFKDLRDAEIAVRAARELFHGDFANHGDKVYLTDEQLMEKLVEAFRRGVDSSHIAMDDQEVEAELLDMIHADAGGHDGWGKKHG